MTHKPLALSTNVIARPNEQHQLSFMVELNIDYERAFVTGKPEQQSLTLNFNERQIEEMINAFSQMLSHIEAIKVKSGVQVCS